MLRAHRRRPTGGRFADGQAETRLPASRLDWANVVKANECVQAHHRR